MPLESSYFVEGSLPRRMATFSAPLVAANLLQYLYQFVDMAIVGHAAGETALVSVSNASSVAFVVSSIVIGLTAGGGAVIARRVGARDVAGQRRAFASLLSVCGALSAFIAAACFLGAGSLFRFMGVPDGALADASSYLRIVGGLCACSFLMNAGCAFLRSQGDARSPLVVMVLSAAGNVLLDALFVILLGMGVPGAAWATVAAQGAAGVFAIAIARSRHAGACFLAGSLRSSRLEALEVLRLGVPGAVQQAVINVSYVIVTAMLNAYGADIAAAAGVGLKASTLAGLPCWAIGQSVATAAAQCLGASDPGRARCSLRIGLALAAGVTLAMQAIIQLFAPLLVCALGAESPRVVEVSVQYLRITCSVNGLFYSSMYVFDSFALASGAPKVVLANSLVDAFVGRVGIAALLAALGLGYIGVFAAQAASPVAPAVIGALYARGWAGRNCSRDSGRMGSFPTSS